MEVKEWLGDGGRPAIQTRGSGTNPFGPSFVYGYRDIAFEVGLHERLACKEAYSLFSATGLLAGDAKQTNCNCYSLPDFLQVIRAKLHGPNVMLDCIMCICVELVHL